MFNPVFFARRRAVKRPGSGAPAVPLYETYFMSNFATNLVAFYRCSDSASPAVDSSSNAFNSVAVGTGVAFGNSNHIPNTNLTSISLNGTAGQTFVQLESSPGSRFRVSQWTLIIWFRRTGAGNTSASGSGSGGILAEPLMMKGGAESETLGVNMNWGMGLEAIGSNFYVSADFEKDATNSATHPTGRNGRMLDVSVASNVFTHRAHTTAAAAAFPHNFSNGDRVRFGGTAITGITANTWLFIVNANQGAGTFQVATTQGGAALTGLGTVAAGGGAWFNHARAATALLSNSDFTNWHMAACTWDGTNLRTYLDGVMGEHEIPTMIPPENISTQLAAIAAYVTSAGARTGAFNGQVQFASVHNVALTAQNLLDLYNNGINVAAPSAPAPTAVLLTDTTTMPTATLLVQLLDATAIDDSSVVAGSVALRKDGVTLNNPADYTFSYDGATDRITLTAVMNGGLFPVGAYDIILN